MKVKVAVSVPEELLRRAKLEVAAGRASSVSQWVSDAMARHAQEDDLETLLRDLDAQYGPPSKEAYEWAERALGLRSSTPED